MDRKNGITYIDETLHGFVSGKKIIRDKTLAGRSRIIFDIYSGIENNDTMPSIRHCVVLGDSADALANIEKGSLVEVAGFIVNHIRKDKSGSISLENGLLKTEEHLISAQAKQIPRHEFMKGHQLPLDNISAVLVDQAS